MSSLPGCTARLLPALPALLLAACATTPDVNPVAVKLDDVDIRLGRVEAVVNNQSLVELSRRIDALEAQLRQLRGNSEEVQNSSEALRKQQRDLYADLNRRLVAVEGTASSPAVPNAAGAGVGTGVAGAAAGATGGGLAPGGDQASYARAMETLKAGDYAAAITQLKAFGSNYGNSALLDNAQYWLGEAYYVSRDYGAAAGAFRSVGERWPNSRKAGDALLKLGFTLYEQKQTAAARTTLQQVVVRFPGTEASRLATERLAKLRAEAN